MSKRNFVLLVIILVLVAIGIVLFLYSRSGTTPPGDENNEDTNFISQFNPFRRDTTTKPPTTTTPGTETPGNENNYTDETPQIPLIKVSSVPVAGFAIFSKERLKDSVPASLDTETKKLVPPLTEFVPAIRYVDRATGNIYQTFADRIMERKFSETTIPRVYEAYFGNNGDSVIMRYLKGDNKTIETFLGALPKERLGEDTNTNNTIKGTFLPTNVRDVGISPDSSKVFYLFDSGNNIVGTVLNLSDNRKVQIFDSPFTEWLSLWGNDKIITLTTKPSANVPGYMYTMDTNGKNLTKVLGGINGLTTLESPDGKSILYSNGNLSLSVYNINTRSSSSLGIRTLPEKCTWNKTSDSIYCAVPRLIKEGNYPDSWYQGEVSFSDQIWKIDVQSTAASLLTDPVRAPGGEDIDGIKLMTDKEEKFLFFVNKKDSFLWKMNLQ